MLVIFQVGIPLRYIEDGGQDQDRRGQGQQRPQSRAGGELVRRPEEEPGIGQVNPVVQHQVIDGQEGEFGRQVQEVPGRAEDQGPPAFFPDKEGRRRQGRQGGVAERRVVRLQAVGMHVEGQYRFFKVSQHGLRNFQEQAGKRRQPAFGQRAHAQGFVPEKKVDRYKSEEGQQFQVVLFFPLQVPEAERGQRRHYYPVLLEAGGGQEKNKRKNGFIFKKKKQRSQQAGARGQLRPSRYDQQLLYRGRVGGQQDGGPESRSPPEAQRQGQVKEQDGRGRVESEIGQVEAERPVAPEREIGHIADRLQRAVIVQPLGEGIPFEGRRQVGGGQGQAGVLLYHSVVVPHEPDVQGKPESQESREQYGRRGGRGPQIYFFRH